MGRKTVFVDIDRLKAAIELTENNGPLRTQLLLWQTVAKLYNLNLPVAEQISYSVVMLRVTQHSIQIKTPPSRNKDISPEHREALTKGKKNRTNPQVNEQNLLNDIPPHKRARYRKLVKDVVKGKWSAIVKLKCLSCADYNTEEIKHCTLNSCSLFGRRPFQGKQNGTDAEVSGET